MSQWPQTHPSRDVQAPDGTLVEVDEGIWPLVQAVWARGWQPGASCQDYGQALLHVRPGNPLLAQLRLGKAWLKMPNDHADAFLAAAAQDPVLAELIPAHPEMADHWAAYTYRNATGLCPSTQISFPADHIP